MEKGFESNNVIVTDHKCWQRCIIIGLIVGWSVSASVGKNIFLVDPDQ